MHLNVPLEFMIIIIISTSGDVYSQSVLDSQNVSVVPMLSSKHKVSKLAEPCILIYRLLIWPTAV